MYDEDIPLSGQAYSEAVGLSEAVTGCSKHKFSKKLENKKMFNLGSAKNFVLEERAVEASKGKKYDDGKAPVVRGFFNYFARAIMAAAMISKYGVDKYKVGYDEQNWREVEDGQERYTDADGRHLLLEAVEGLYDEESGYLHAAHHFWDAGARLEKLLESGVSLENPNPKLNLLHPTARARYLEKVNGRCPKK